GPAGALLPFSRADLGSGRRGRDLLLARGPTRSLPGLRVRLPGGHGDRGGSRPGEGVHPGRERLDELGGPARGTAVPLGVGGDVPLAGAHARTSSRSRPSMSRKPRISDRSTVAATVTAAARATSRETMAVSQRSRSEIRWE